MLCIFLHKIIFADVLYPGEILEIVNYSFSVAFILPAAAEPVMNYGARIYFFSPIGSYAALKWSVYYFNSKYGYSNIKSSFNKL